MFAQDTIDYDASSAAEALDSLLEMKANIPNVIIQQRASKRLEIRTRVVAQPGNSSERNTHTYKGVTGDISQDGSQIIFPTTVAVGDIFWLTFEGNAVVNGSVLARCVRCRFIREDAFETGFRFFEPIQIRSHA